MKKDIHPEYHLAATVRCNGCGTTFQTGSVMKELSLTICSSCHPYYTGQQRFVDTAGRVDRFKKKYGENTVFAAKA